MQTGHMGRDREVRHDVTKVPSQNQTADVIWYGPTVFLLMSPSYPYYLLILLSSFTKLRDNISFCNLAKQATK